MHAKKSSAEFLVMVGFLVVFMAVPVVAGAQVFNPKVDYPVGPSPNGVIAWDYNLDGNPDLVIANDLMSDYNTAGSISILLGNSATTFQAPQVVYQLPLSYNDGAHTFDYFGPNSAVSGDFNEDGEPDLAFPRVMRELISYPFPGYWVYASDIVVLLGNGDGTFTYSCMVYTGGLVPPPGSGDSSRSLAVGDFNGDGHEDLVVVNTLDGSYAEVGDTLSVAFGNGDGTFQVPNNYTVGWLPWSVVVADFNGDGWDDIGVTNYEDGTVSILLNMADGTGTFGNKSDYTVGANPTDISAGYIRSPYVPLRVDLAVANYGSNTVSILMGDGNGRFQPKVDYPVGNGPTSIVTWDFNKDYYLDIAVTNSGDNTISTLLNNGDGTFQPKVDYPVGTDPRSLTVFNASGDLAVANNGDGTVSVLINKTRLWPCFISTAAFGTALDGKTQVLRSFRDAYLTSNPLGKVFIDTYYKYSPVLADYIAHREWLRGVVRILLTPVIGFISLFV